eukprot:714364-Amphidinium_carterae.1
MAIEQENCLKPYDITCRTGSRMGWFRVGIVHAPQTALWYARPHIVFGDGVYQRAVLELRVDPSRQKRWPTAVPFKLKCHSIGTEECRLKFATTSWEPCPVGVFGFWALKRGFFLQV